MQSAGVLVGPQSEPTSSGFRVNRENEQLE